MAANHGRGRDRTLGQSRSPAFWAAVAEGVVDSAALAVGGAGGEPGVGVRLGPRGAHVDGVALAAERERGPGGVVTGLG